MSATAMKTKTTKTDSSPFETNEAFVQRTHTQSACYATLVALNLMALAFFFFHHLFIYYQTYKCKSWSTCPNRKRRETFQNNGDDKYTVNHAKEWKKDREGRRQGNESTQACKQWRMKGRRREKNASKHLIRVECFVFLQLKIRFEQ